MTHCLVFSHHSVGPAPGGGLCSPVVEHFAVSHPRSPGPMVTMKHSAQHLSKSSPVVLCGLIKLGTLQEPCLEDRILRIINKKRGKYRK